MIQKHILNVVDSLQLFEECQDIIKVNECYTNVFYIFLRKRNFFRSDGWKVAYGYYRIFPDLLLMARHCFLVNNQREAIDPTLFINGRRNEQEIDKEYVSFKIFDSNEEYLSMIADDNGFPDLNRSLWSLDLEFEHFWARNESFVLIR
ncbi:hypothetical protein IAQ67_15375 [Paenibacillus peoriae]|uniref:Uncharacterized protein n=1 Tax=Paenibacillus peoriae TaxID=59893 RepID=A0A7H0Y2H7_9BACL|nr:hypothetical protein [Paenibacillus peoriae]QNR65285.1 hypothetical protein IAQ67_15375 [Paenibacillus peoriae]